MVFQKQIVVKTMEKSMKIQKIVLAFILMTLVVTAYAQQYDPESDFTVSKQEDGKSVVITEYIGSKKDVRIPPTIQGLPVTGISKNVFYPRSNLTSVTIPDGVISIGAWAFNYCTNLISVTIPGSVTSIGSYAFYGCKSLTGVTIPSSVTSVRTPLLISTL
jgi:hypothetical protein